MSSDNALDHGAGHEQPDSQFDELFVSQRYIVASSLSPKRT